MAWKNDKNHSVYFDSIKEAKVQCRSIFSYVPDGVFLINARAIILECNNCAVDLYGYCRDEMLGTHLAELMTARSRTVFEEKFKRFVQLDEQEGEIQIIGKNGRVVEVWRKGVPLADPDNRFIGGLIFDRDITRQIRAQQLIEILQNLTEKLTSDQDLENILKICLDTMLENTPMDSGGIYLVDAQSGNLNLIYSKGLGADFVRVTSCVPSDSPSMKLLREGRFIYSDYSKLSVPLDPSRYNEGLRSVAILPIQYERRTVACVNIASHSLEKIDPVERRAMQTMVAQLGSFIVRANEKQYRIQAEKEAAKTEEKYRHSQKMEAIGRLAGGVAHDFNNVLCAITGNTDLALDSIPLNDPLRELLNEVSSAARHASDLTQQLLAFSRKQVLAPRLIDLGKLIGNLHGMLTRLISDDIVMKTVSSKDQGRVLVDPIQVEQILLNLAINAKDAMPDGGELRIETSKVELDEDYCANRVDVTAGTYVMLSVSDTGVGMSEEVRDKIFEPFFTTKELGRGTGLGLATVFGIVEQNNGRIEVYSEKGKGSSFKIYFPCAEAEAEAIERRTERRAAGGSETILVVEDEEMLRKLAVKQLNRLGYHVLDAKSSSDAITLAEQHNGSIHLMMTDVVMPHMNGLELAQRIGAIRPDIKILYVSGYTHNVIVHHGLLNDGINFLAKPYSIDVLDSHIREILDR